MAENSESYGDRRSRELLSAPIMINLELTSGCNIKCRHCYNFWREDAIGAPSRITKDQMDRLVEMVVSDGVFHVVLTGGEPLLNFGVLEYSLMKLHKAGCSTSVNSNLILATSEKINRLRAAGMDHVLTSLNSHIPEVNDYMSNKKGSFDKTLEGIRTAVNAGVRVSVNMIISEHNRNQVYETARLCSELGAQRIFGTRLVPSENVGRPGSTEFSLQKDGALRAINDLIEAHNDFGIGIGSLISYPLCLLGDLEKYEAFVGRGCPAQRGNRMVINPDGEAHACTHESMSYGNVFDIGIRGVFGKMRKWHDGSFIYKECVGCAYEKVCGSGCRSAAYSYFGKMNEKDPLFEGRNNITRHYRADIKERVIKAIDDNDNFIVPEEIRFRKEDGFCVINVRWANALNIGSKLADFLIEKQRASKAFSVKDMVGEEGRRKLINLVIKEAVIPEDEDMRKLFESAVKSGCSIDPRELPQKLFKIGNNPNK